MGILNKFIWVAECSNCFYENLKCYRGITTKKIRLIFGNYTDFFYFYGKTHIKLIMFLLLYND